MSGKYTDVDSSILKSINNIAPKKYVNIHRVPEITFLGSEGKPDFALLTIEIVYRTKIIELKSLKEYFFQWRAVHVSYERFIATVYNHLEQTYIPEELKLTLLTTPRGGISTEIIYPISS